MGSDGICFIYYFQWQSMYGFGAAIQKVSESEIEKKVLEQKDKKSLWLLEVIQHPGAIVNTISTTAIFLSILAVM